MTEFLARVGDRINPIVVKETRQAVSSRLVAAFLLLFLTVQLVVMLLLITNRELADQDDLNLQAGRALFTVVQGILLGACMVLIPTMTGARLAAERSDVNVDLLFISSLTPRAVLSGKLFAAAALALLIFSACAPFMTFAYVMRGLDVPTILLVLVADYLAVLLATMFALFLASVPANRGLRIFLGAGGFFIMCSLGARLLQLSDDFLRSDTSFDLGSWEFWTVVVLVAALVLGVIGLLFVWSVALISPAAANRALPVRVYTLVFWIGTALGFGGWSLYVKKPGPMFAWGLIGCALFSLQLITASCERDSWGPRVARWIPHRPIFRFPAFFFFSGAAGGLAFGAFGAVLTAVVIALWAKVVRPGGYGERAEPLILAALVAGYTYCYCLSAVTVRRLLTGSTFRIGYTWVVGVLLFGLGCTLPYIARSMIFDRSARYRYSDELMPLYLTNPVVMIDDALRGSLNTHRPLTIAFLVVWGGVVTVVNMGWFVKQVLEFRPPERDEGPPA
jgi:hypothetical protein